MSRILIIDDEFCFFDRDSEPANAYAAYYTFALQQAGFEVLGANSFADAKDCLITNSDFELIVIDMVLPDASGESIAQWLQKNYSNIPAVFLSGKSIQSLTEAASSLENVVAVFGKLGTTPYDLVDVVRKIIRKN